MNIQYFYKNLIRPHKFLDGCIMAVTCMIRKWGLLTFKPTEQNRSWTRRLFAFTPLMRYLFRPPMTTCTQQRHKLYYYCLYDAISEISDLWPNTCRVMVISSWVSKPRGLCFLLELSKVMDTVALVIPARPFLYTRSWRLVARTYNVWHTKTSSITAFELCNSHLFIY